MSGIVLKRTEKDILREINGSDVPLSKKQLADNLDVVYQTIQNHINNLLSKGLVKAVEQRGKTTYYGPSDPTDRLFPIVWKNNVTTVPRLVRELIADHSPVANVYARNVVNILAEMYKLTANAIDDEDPQPITIAQMKAMQSRLSQIHTNLKQLERTVNSLLDNDLIWDPKKVVTEVIIKDPEMDVPTARSIYQGLKELLEGE